MDEKKENNPEFYTKENPGGPWSKALQAMLERDRRLKAEKKAKSGKADETACETLRARAY